MKRIISLVLSFAILLTAFCITAYAGTTETNYKYLDRFLEKYSYLENEYLYDELYEYYADDNTGDTPDWVLIFASGDCPEPGTASGIFDEYYIFEHAYYYPYGLGYFIYIPEKNDFFTLEFAWMENVEGIEKAFTECLIKSGYASYVKDIDKDGKITKVDANAMVHGIYNYNSFIERPYIYFNANTSKWENFEKVFCEITENDGSLLYKPQSTSSLCTDFDGDGIWKYDIYNLSYILEHYSPWSINFHNENGDFTTQLTFTEDNINDTAICMGTDENGTPILKWRESAKDAIAEYEANTGEKVETNRYYFLMPNGKNGEKGTDSDGYFYNEFAPSWYEDHVKNATVYWWDSGIADPDGSGYTMEQSNSDSVFYADVPTKAETIIFNNYLGLDSNELGYYKATKTFNLFVADGYEKGESALYPEGIDSFNNMIFVINPSLNGINEFTNSFGGEWYYYYGDGCYGTVKDGDENNCVRADHFHKDIHEDFVEYLGISMDDEHTYNGPLYSHYEDGAQAPSWILVEGYGGKDLPYDILFGVFGDYYLYGCSSTPSYFNYHVYMVDEQKFYTIENAWDKDICSKEEMFTEYLVPNKSAQLIGDANSDGELSILDATIIQQAQAKMCILEDWIMATHVYGEKIVFSTDVDHDGDRTVFDATAIQMKLAKLN